MRVAFVREDRNWQGARLREACERDVTTGFNVRPRVERTIGRPHRFVDDFGETFEPDEVGATPADKEHSSRGDQID
jgi:hypothetical protein